MMKTISIGLTVCSLCLPLSLIPGGAAFAQSDNRSRGSRTRFSRGTNTSTGRLTTGNRTGSSDSNRKGTASSPSTSSGAKEAKETEKDDEKKTETSSAPAGSQGGGLRGFIKRNYMMILGILGAALGGFIIWFYLGARGKHGSESFLESLDAELEETPARGLSSTYSSTKISASDVNARLGGTVSGTEVETDREYALVVEKEALKRPLPGEVDERTGREYAEDSVIRNSLNEKNFESAYSAYCNRIEDDGESEFHDDVEHAMSEHFIRQREFQKAAHILEHHVATHAKESVEPQVYFNLGYIHFLTKTFNKSRRFLRLFTKSEKDPQYVARAESILQTLNQKINHLN